MEFATILKDGTVQDASPELIEEGPEPFYDLRKRDEREALLRKYPMEPPPPKDRQR